MLGLCLMLALAGCGFLPGAGPSDDDEDCDPEDDADCPVTEEYFEDEFVDRYCDAWRSCNPGEECPIGPENVQSAPPGCDFDPEEAEACLNGEYECADYGGDYGYPVPPPACGYVYECEHDTAVDAG